MLSPLQLNEPVKFDSILLQHNPNFKADEEQDEYSFVNQAGLSVQHEDSQIYGVKYKVFSHLDKNVPFVVKIVMVGVFHFEKAQLAPKSDESEYSDDEVREIVLANASNVIYGIIRQKLAEFSSMAGDGKPIILPLVHPRFFAENRMPDSDEETKSIGDQEEEN